MNATIQQTFIIGDEWLFYKLYTGPKTADVILTEIIKPITEKLVEDKVIDKWFFIRYADPKQHIRLRFHYTNPKHVFNIVQMMNTTLKPYIEQNLIWKVQLDTYQREIERYGSNTMELSESLFFYDSTTLISMLDLIEGDSGEKIRWLYSLRAIDEFLNDFRFDLQKKMDFTKTLADNFAKEFGSNSFLIKQLSNKFRENKKLIHDVMDRDKDQESDLKLLLNLLNQRSERSKQTVNAILDVSNKNILEIPLENLLGSHIHMMMNRIFKSKQRIHELVVYDFLYQYYKSIIARQKYDNATTFKNKNLNEILA